MANVPDYVEGCIVVAKPKDTEHSCMAISLVAKESLIIKNTELKVSNSVDQRAYIKFLSTGIQMNLLSVLEFLVPLFYIPIIGFH